ncbi:MAG: hypothetical protein ACJAZW_001024 [Maritalea sp.]
MLDAWWVLFSTCANWHSSNDHGDQNNFDGALSKGIKGFSTSGRFKFTAKANGARRLTSHFYTDYQDEISNASRFCNLFELRRKTVRGH